MYIVLTLCMAAIIGLVVYNIVRRDKEQQANNGHYFKGEEK